MRIGRTIDVNSFGDYKLANILKDIIGVVDGRLSKEDNLQGRLISNFFFETANFNYPLDHNLGRIVSHFIVLKKNQFSDFMSGTIAPTSNRIYIQCNTPNTTADLFIWG